METMIEKTGNTLFGMEIYTDTELPKDKLFEFRWKHINWDGNPEDPIFEEGDALILLKEIK